MPTYLTHFTCNCEAWPTDKDGQKTAWTKIIRDTADNVREGGPVKFIGWVSNTEGYVALYAGCGSKAPCARSYVESSGGERNYNIYPRTRPQGAGGSAKNAMKTGVKNFAGAAERTRTSTGCPASTSS
jgi:hypothetical protein